MTETRNCQNCKKSFVIEDDDFGFYEKMQVPPPTFCPDCRRMRRYAWYNLVNLFYRDCDLCSKRFISMYPPNGEDKRSQYKVYCPTCWWSDNWDWRDYGRDYDFSRPFFEQFDELMHQAPLLGLSINATTTPGSPYNNHAADLKDCYLTFNTDFNQECEYGFNVTQCRDVSDCSMVMSCDACYDCSNLYKSSRVVGSRGNNRFCIDSAFLRDCENCTNCFMCANLKNKSYCFKNEQLTKEAYLEKRAQYDLGSHVGYQKAQTEAQDFWKSVVPRPAWDTMSVNCTGSYIFESKNCHECYDCAYCEDCKYCISLYRAPQKNCYDICDFGYGLENAYESGVTGEFASNVKFVQESGINLTDSAYCKLAITGSNQFGCVSARKGDYVIFNKQYTKDEYTALREKIIKHIDDMPYSDTNGHVYKYGEFFPPQIAPFPYQHTFANLFYPKTDAQVLAMGGWKHDDSKREYSITKKAADVLDHISHIDDSILSETIECSDCKKGYKIIPLELQLLRKLNICIPRQCPFCRIDAKLRIWVNNMRLKDRTCDNCNKQFRTHYEKDRAPVIYCKECYQQEFL